MKIKANKLRQSSQGIRQRSKCISSYTIKKMKMLQKFIIWYPDWEQAYLNVTNSLMIKCQKTVSGAWTLSSLPRRDIKSCYTVISPVWYLPAFKSVKFGRELNKLSDSSLIRLLCYITIVHCPWSCLKEHREQVLKQRHLQDAIFSCRSSS